MTERGADRNSGRYFVTISRATNYPPKARDRNRSIKRHLRIEHCRASQRFPRIVSYGRFNNDARPQNGSSRTSFRNEEPLRRPIRRKSVFGRRTSRGTRFCSNVLRVPGRTNCSPLFQTIRRRLFLFFFTSTVRGN